MVCTFLMPLLWEGKDVMNALRESCTAIHVIPRFKTACRQHSVKYKGVKIWHSIQYSLKSLTKKIKRILFFSIQELFSQYLLKKALGKHEVLYRQNANKKN